MVAGSWWLSAEKMTASGTAGCFAVVAARSFCCCCVLLWRSEGRWWRCHGADSGEAAAAAIVVEGDEKIRVRVLGDEDDDVAESDWLIW